jgi:hypothetical protein
MILVSEIVNKVSEKILYNHKAESGKFVKKSENIFQKHLTNYIFSDTIKA